MLKMDLISPVQRTGQFICVKVSTILCFFYVLNLIETDIVLLQNSWQQKHVYLCASYFTKCATNWLLNMNAIGITWLVLIFRKSCNANSSP